MGFLRSELREKPFPVLVAQVDFEILQWLDLSSSNLLVAFNKSLIVRNIGVIILKKAVALPNSVDSRNSTEPVVHCIGAAIEQGIPLPHDNSNQNERMGKGVEKQMQIDFTVVETNTVAHPLAVMIHHKYALLASPAVRRSFRLVSLAYQTIPSLHYPFPPLRQRLLLRFVGVRLAAPVETQHQPGDEQHVPGEEMLLVGPQHQPIDYKQD